MMEKKGLGGLLAGNITFRSLNIVCSVLITFLLTRLMDTGGYGVLSLLIANAVIFNLLTCLGAESGITYHYSSGNIRKPSLFSIAYLVILFQFLVVMLVELCYHAGTGQYVLTEVNGPAILFWGVLYFTSITVIDKYQAFLNAAHLYTQANKIAFVSNLVTLLAYLYCYLYQPVESAAVYLNIFILASVLQAVCTVFFFHYYTKQPLVFGTVRKDDWKLFFSYSAIVLITNIIQFLAYRIDYWFIDYYHGKDQLGLYSLAVKLGQMLWMIPLLMAGILFPRVAGNAGDEEEGKWLALIRITNAFLLLVSVMAALLAGWAIPFFAGESFRESIVPFIYLLPGLLFFCCNIIFAAYFAGKGMTMVNLRGSGICFLIVLVGDILLIPAFGIRGAAIASSLAYTAAGLHHLYLFAMHKKIPLSSVIMIQDNDWKMIRFNIKKYIRRV